MFYIHLHVWLFKYAVQIDQMCVNIKYASCSKVQAIFLD